jgi:hypothetical protein
VNFTAYIAKAQGLEMAKKKKIRDVPQYISKNDIPELLIAHGHVLKFFEGDTKKALLWFATPNPMLGDITPTDMATMGRVKKLLKFVETAVNENKGVDQ